MNRLLVRRCSMSSIEEEDELSTSDEVTIQPKKSSTTLQTQKPQLYHSSSVADWDSELSESEQEFDDNDDDPNENGEDRAANRALQNFMQTCSKTVCSFFSCFCFFCQLIYQKDEFCNWIVTIKVVQRDYFVN